MAWSVIIFARSQATAVETVGKDGSASRKKKHKKKKHQNETGTEFRQRLEKHGAIMMQHGMFIRLRCHIRRVFKCRMVGNIYNRASRSSTRNIEFFVSVVCLLIKV